MGKVEKKEKYGGRRAQSKGEEVKKRQRKKASEFEVGDVDSDDDDKEANEDLSLKIVEKAMLRKCSKNGSSSITDDGNFIVMEDDDDDEVVMNFTVDNKVTKKESKKKKKKKVEAQLESVPSEKDAKLENFLSDMLMADAAKDEKVESEKTSDVVDEAGKTNPVEVSDNSVLRKLLRGPRYFDPPDSSWGTCYNCGEEGHMAVNCTSAKRQKPCFVCGSLEHQGKQCTKGHDCYICRKEGHRAKDCPERNNRGIQHSSVCLKCGDSGHDMFSCTNDYSSDDLKEIECYVCGSVGHLCCVNYTDTGLRAITCYRCGLSGHTGLFCSGPQKKAANTGSAQSCYKCGEEGHFARECINSSQGSKRKNKQRHKKEAGSAPPELGKERKKKKAKSENQKVKSEKGFSSASKPKGKYGWSTEHPGDYANNNGATSWKSPATPNSKRFRTPDYAATNHASTSYSPGQHHTLHYSNSSASYGTPSFNQPRNRFWNPHYSASYSPGAHHGNRYAPNSGYSAYNGSPQFYQNPFDSNSDNSSNFARRRNHHW